MSSELACEQTVTIYRILPDLTDDLAARQWLWLVQRTSTREALGGLERAVRRGRKPWPYNAAREMGLRCPVRADDPELPPLPNP